MCVCAQVCACVCVCVYACRRVVCAYVHTTCPILGLQELSSESSFVYIFIHSYMSRKANGALVSHLAAERKSASECTCRISSMY